jgi:hypothetical protein
MSGPVNFAKVDWREVYRRYQNQQWEEIAPGVKTCKTMKEIIVEVWREQQKEVTA